MCYAMLRALRIVDAPALLGLTPVLPAALSLIVVGGGIIWLRGGGLRDVRYARGWLVCVHWFPRRTRCCAWSRGARGG